MDFLCLFYVFFKLVFAVFDVFCYIYGFSDVFLEWFWYGFNMFFYMVVGYFNICFQLKTREIFDFFNDFARVSFSPKPFQQKI